MMKKKDDSRKERIIGRKRGEHEEGNGLKCHKKRKNQLKYCIDKFFLGKFNPIYAFALTRSHFFSFEL